MPINIYNIFTCHLIVWSIGLELHKKINCSNAFQGHKVYISKYEHVLHVFKPVYLFVFFIMSYLSAPEPTLWSALSAREKSTAQYTDPCPLCNPSLTLLSPSCVPLLSSLLLSLLLLPLSSLSWVLHTLLFPRCIPLLFFFFPPSVFPSLLAFSLFL